MYDSGTVDRTWSFVHGQELTAKVDKLHLTPSLFNAQIQDLNLKRKIEKKRLLLAVSQHLSASNFNLQLGVGLD